MIININCKTGMQLFLADNSVDAIVCDPPYELGFMGKTWDSSGIAYDVGMWAECLRVLKPGGHLLAFGGSRTAHRMVCAIEDAGFEVRDSIVWIYGSGFPKSLDVSKAIDKANGRGLEDWYALGRHIRARREAKGLTVKQVNAQFGGTALCNHWEAQNQNNAIPPTPEHWARLKSELGCSAEFDEIVDRAGAPRDVVGIQKGAMAGWSMDGGTKFVDRDITVPATDAARQWEGWGTALKPAHEPICVARKPLTGTVAANILAHGTGAINIDACRVEVDPNDTNIRDHTKHERTTGSIWGAAAGATKNLGEKGRWPANLIHDGSDEVLAGFPDSNGSGPARTLKRSAKGENNGWGMNATAADSSALPDAGTGSAARFFKTCKQDDSWLDLNLPHENAIAAEPNLYQQKQSAVSALEAVVKSAFPAGLCAAVSLSVQPTTSATGPELKRLAESLMQTILNIDCGFWHESQPARLSLSRNHVKIVAHLEPTGTTTITANHWKLDGSVDSATFSITLTSSAAGAKDCAPSSDNARFIYCAKASTAERGAGNNHPTVKPIALMRYLVRLVTPPGGLVLDPFTGSGTTAVAAKLEGAQFMGFELSPEYAAIATARVDAIVGVK